MPVPTKHQGARVTSSSRELTSRRALEQRRDHQLVEITALLTVVNLDRFNVAFGIKSAGFSEGMVCVPPDRPASEPVVQRVATDRASLWRLLAVCHCSRVS